MKIASPSLLVSALLLASPAFAQCVDDKCEVKVFMSAGCGSGIKVAPDPLFVGSGKNVEITWTIVSPDWMFDEKIGINVQLATTETFEKLQPANKQGFKFKHKNKGPRAFKYDVNLIGTGGSVKGQKCQLDPTIVDQ